jgi:uncharacterized protein
MILANAPNAPLERALWHTGANGANNDMNSNIEAMPVTFKVKDITIAGALWLPKTFEANQNFPALVIATPGSSVKEQIAANYGRRLAEKGYIVLAFDPSYQGQSGGEPRDLEDPYARVEDIRCAVDFLTTLDYVDEEHIGILGVCAGGGYAVNASLTERRIKAVATVVGSDMGRAFRQMDPSADAVTKMLEEVGRQRTREARGEAARRDPWIPDTPEAAKAAGIDDPDLLEAVDFYRTSRGKSEHSTNRLLFRSFGPILGFDAFHLVEELLTQPIQVIVAGRLGKTFSYADGLRLWEKAKNRKDLVVIESAGHYDMYDHPEYVDRAVTTLAAFYDEYLKVQSSEA